MSETTSNNRIENLDVLRGLTILMIIAFHVLGETILTYHHFVACMCLEVFLFVAGYFFRGFRLKSTLKKLVLPYAAMLCLIKGIWIVRTGEPALGAAKEVAEQILLGYTIDDLWQGQSVYVGIAWFFPFLAASRLVYAGVSRVSENRMVRGAICLALGAAGVFCVRFTGGAKEPWSIDVVLATMIFVWCGDLCHEHSALFMEACRKIRLLPVTLVGWYLLQRICGFSELPSRRYGGGLCYIVISLLAVASMLLVSTWISCHPGRLTGFLSLCGRDSMYILLLHIFDKSCIPYPDAMNIWLRLVLEMTVAVVPVVLWELYRGRKKEHHAENA